MEAKKMSEIISSCYNIPENKKTFFSEEKWKIARRAIDVAIFRAGIKEVVEWIDKNIAVHDWDGKWQGKKKEWGIEQ